MKLLHYHRYITLNYIVKYCCGYGLKDHPCSERPRIVSKKLDLARSKEI